MGKIAIDQERISILTSAVTFIATVLQHDDAS